LVQTWVGLLVRLHLKLKIQIIMLFLLEIKIPSYGILTIGGVISLVIGSIMLIDSPLPFFQISWQVIAGAAITTTLFFAFAVGMGIKAQTRKPETGREGLVGEVGLALKDISPEGVVQVHGEIWKAVSSKKIRKGQKVIVESVDPHHLKIKVKAVK